VVKGFDGECFTTYDQNPDPVHPTEYCPNRQTGGSVIIYRLSSSRLLLNGDEPAIADATGFKTQSQGIPQSLLWSASIAAVALFAMAGRRVWKMRRQSATPVDRVLLNEEAPDVDMEESLE
jgi:hypothetical protein